MSRRTLGIILTLAVAEYRRLYGDVLLGVLWPTVRALIFVLAVYLVVFSGIRGDEFAELRFEDFLWLVSGYACWYVISESGSKCIGIVSDSKQVVFTYGLDVLAVATRQFFLSLPTSVVLFGLVFMGMAYTGVTPPLMLCAVLAALMAHSMAVFTAIWVAYLTLMRPYFRELFPLFFQFGFWLTPIIWEPSESLSSLAKYNPFYQPISLIRVSGAIEIEQMLTSAAVLAGILVMILLSVAHVRRQSKFFADYL